MESVAQDSPALNLRNMRPSDNLTGAAHDAQESTGGVGFVGHGVAFDAVAIGGISGARNVFDEHGFEPRKAARLRAAVVSRSSGCGLICTRPES